ncbi:hypothetical protein DPMN_113506 [Dreissena polymorpha]|uniref:TIR domain-containing protein n=2 Tax=Dreissena polymorpha TaxID=45954 RepID=A0A9D4KIJ1_DREPO|nr:hypothetical protein DPMN_113506 [Dreissena polymorpha]
MVMNGMCTLLMLLCQFIVFVFVNGQKLDNIGVAESDNVSISKIINRNVSDDVDKTTLVEVPTRDLTVGPTRNETESQTVNLAPVSRHLTSRAVNSNNHTEIRDSNRSSGSNRIELPALWKDFCTLYDRDFIESYFTPRTPLITINCTVTHLFSGVWKLTDLRMMIDRYNDTVFGLVINCESMSIISIPWTIKASRLYKMIVTNCVIEDYFTEYNSPVLNEIPDTLRYWEIRNNVIQISVAKFINITINVRNISKEFDCFHEDTIEYISDRNTSYEFIHDADEQMMSKLSDVGETLVLEAQNVNHICAYKRLLKFEEGLSYSRSIYHTKLLTDKARFMELRVYNVSYNYINVLQDQHLQWSTKFPKLELLDLSHNKISKLYKFEIPLHTRPDQLTTINLQYNNITTITVEDLDRFRDMPMMLIDIRNNPISCNCSEKFRELLRYIKEGRHVSISNLTDYSYIGRLKCDNPSKLLGRDLMTLTEEEVCVPEVEYFVGPVIVLSVSVIIISIILIVVLKYRQEITIIMFTRFNIIVPCRTRANFDSTKKYDAFVSYSSNEEEHVEKLFEDLESTPDDKPNAIKFKFCLHHRDFVPGKTIFDNVSKSVESSRHTIILLSNHFLKSQYCLYEFQEAFRQSIMEKKRHLVIVMMEDIPEDSLPRDLKRCINTFTYIRRDDYLFTERLIYALSVKHKEKIIKPKTVANIEATEQKKDSKRQISVFFNSRKKSVTTRETDIMKDASLDIIKDNTLTRKVEPRLSTECMNELNETVIINNNENANPKDSQVVRKLTGKLDINIPPHSNEHYVVEKKISNLECDYGRSLSSDIGYGSAYNSPEIRGDIATFSVESVA